MAASDITFAPVDRDDGRDGSPTTSCVIAQTIEAPPVNEDDGRDGSPTTSCVIA